MVTECIDRCQGPSPRLTAIWDGDTLGAKAFGLLHLMGAHFAARDSDAAAVDHLDEAVPCPCPSAPTCCPCRASR